MEYILILISVLFISQILKYLIRLFSKAKDKRFSWAFMWATGAPSAHSAVLASGLIILYKDIGLSSIFVFCLIVSVILMYNLVADRQREKIREEFLTKGGEVEREIVSSGRVMDISGHSFFDIISGIFVGAICTQLLLILLL